MKSIVKNFGQFVNENEYVPNSGKSATPTLSNDKPNPPAGIMEKSVAFASGSFHNGSSGTYLPVERE